MMLLLAACATYSPPVYIEPSFIQVSLGDAALGSESAPLPFPTQPARWTVTVQTLDKHQAPYAFDGDLRLTVRPGLLTEVSDDSGGRMVAESEALVHVTGGAWTGTVTLEHSFGPTRIWASDEGDLDSESPRVASWATGVSDAIWYGIPTIAEMQATVETDSNALAGEYANIQAEGREIVVTALTTNGLWVTDTLDEPGSGNSVFVYTFSKPDDSLAIGAHITKLAGIDQEYLATTQFYWPTIEAGKDTLPVPSAIELTSSTACDETAMEGIESSRVEVLSGEVPADFGESSPDWEGFVTYGQWPLTVGSCTIYVESSGAAPDFYPPDYAGQSLPRVTGMAKEIFGMYVISVVDAADIESPNGPRARHSTPRTAHSPASRADWLR